MKLKDFAVAPVNYAKVDAGLGLQIQFITRLLFSAGTLNMALPKILNLSYQNHRKFRQK